MRRNKQIEGPLSGPFSWVDRLRLSNLQAWPEARAEVAIVGAKLCFRAENGAVVASCRKTLA